MPEEFETKNEISELKARLFEKERIEAYLRSEVSDLWKVIKVIQEFPLYGLYLKISKLYSKIKRTTNATEVTQNAESSSSEIGLPQLFDLLFIVPSNKLEIGGIVSAHELVNFLNSMKISTKVLALNIDPSVERNEINIDINQIQNASYKVVVVCGSEAANFLHQNKLGLSKKIVLFMQGPDHYFEKKWEAASIFTDLISKSDLVIAISPYVKSIAKFYGAKNVITAPFGLDKNTFYGSKNPKEKIIAISCRANRDKGTHLVIPIISHLRKQGWKIIGFGELPDLSMASEFDDFLGRITKDEIGNLFRRSKILLDPSLIEGLGLVALEAAACGCVPIITSRNSYEGLINSTFKPYVEIPNFLDPKLIIDTINEIEKKNNYDAYCESILELDMNSGLNNSYLAIKELLRPE